MKNCKFAVKPRTHTVVAQKIHSFDASQHVNGTIVFKKAH